MAAPAGEVLIAVGEAPPLAMGMTYVAMAGSIALHMENAAAAQQRGRVIGETVLVKLLEMIIVKGGAS